MKGNTTVWLVAGDGLALLILTVIGFVTHREVGLQFAPRMAATWIPLLVGWFGLAPALGLYDSERVRRAGQLWRPALTAFFAAQLAVTLRGLWLQAAVLPTFALVLGATSALGMTVWRGLVVWFSRGK